MNDTDVTFEVWGTNEYGEEYRVTERNESGAREVAELMNRISEAGRHYYVVKAITTRTPV